MTNPLAYALSLSAIKYVAFKVNKKGSDINQNKYFLFTAIVTIFYHAFLQNRVNIHTLMKSVRAYSYTRIYMCVCNMINQFKLSQKFDLRRYLRSS